jgi:hypothetical protein
MGTTNNDILKTEERGVHVKRPFLIGTAGEFEGQIIELPERIRLGRHPQNDLCFSDPTVSAFHAQITAVGARYEIMDLRGKNRSKLNRKKIHRPVFLADNDLIEIGRNSFRFRLPRSRSAADTGSKPDNNTACKPENQLCSSDESLRTHQTQGYSAAGCENSNVEGDVGKLAIKGMAQQAIESQVRIKRDRPKIKRVVVSLLLRVLASFIIVLIIALPIIVKFVPITSPTVPEQNNVSQQNSPWDHLFHLSLIQRIWQGWESKLSEEQPDIEDIGSFLDQTLRKADQQMQMSAPDARWQFYKTCLMVIRVTKRQPEYTEYSKQAELLLMRVKIEIEDQEQKYASLLKQAKEAGNRSNAGTILQQIKDLLDLENDNKESDLAQLYNSL